MGINKSIKNCYANNGRQLKYKLILKMMRTNFGRPYSIFESFLEKSYEK